MKKVDEDMLMEKIFEFLKDMPGFENLQEIRYDAYNHLVWISIGIMGRAIPIRDDWTWLGITREIITELEKEKLWMVYLDTTNKKPMKPEPMPQIDVIPVGANCGRAMEYGR
ncbi:MAG: hypothetical protein NC548_56805 [Lachnospiraceae bacterium]|nr:hypothetical protein [Lachnospiraceae bacterium]